MAGNSDSHEVPAAAEGVFEFPVDVTASVIDRNGHVNNVAYVKWMQDAAVAHVRARIPRDAAAMDDSTWVARSHFIEYLRPVVIEDRIVVKTWVAEFRRVRSLRRYHIVRQNDQQLVARGETDWVFIASDTGRPRSIPELIRSAFVLLPDE
ncbi:MAG: thioesterase family protein [Planctomycetaceae bacterium]